MKTLHFEMIFNEDGVRSRKEGFLLQDEMFHTYRYVLFWSPLDSMEEMGEDVILREQYPNIYLAIKNLRNIKNLEKVRRITDPEMYNVEDFIKKEINEEAF